MSWRLCTGVAIIACLGGCDGPSCLELCEEGQSCPDRVEADSSGCGPDCERLAGLNEESGCSNAYEEVLDCIQEAGVCDVDVEICRAAQSTWFDCTSEYCARNPRAESCRNPRG